MDEHRVSRSAAEPISLSYCHGLRGGRRNALPENNIRRQSSPRPAIDLGSEIATATSLDASHPGIPRYRAANRKISRDQAPAILKNDIVLSDAMANQEVERYTFWAPGQANAYFYGYTRLRVLRTEVENAMGAWFRPKAFHDFVLAQGLLPPRLLKKAVFEEFVGNSTPSSAR
jgi:hypothetical protein